jgi:hypothetical protein
LAAAIPEPTGVLAAYATVPDIDSLWLAESASEFPDAPEVPEAAVLTDLGVRRPFEDLQRTRQR